MARKPRPSEIAAKAKKSSVPKAAKKSKPGTKAVSKAEIEAAESKAPPPTIKLPSERFIRDFIVVKLAALETEKNSAVGDIGSAISVATEKNNVEKRALAIVRRLHKMPDKKFQETWFHLQHYFGALGFQERADKQGQLDLKQAPEAEGDDGDDGEAANADEAPAGTDGVPSPRLKLVDAPQQSTADAMSDAIKADEASSKVA